MLPLIRYHHLQIASLLTVEISPVALGLSIKRRSAGVYRLNYMDSDAENLKFASIRNMH